MTNILRMQVGAARVTHRGGCLLLHLTGAPASTVTTTTCSSKRARQLGQCGAAMAERFFFNDLQDYDPNMAKRGDIVGMSKEEADDMGMLRTVKPIEYPPIMNQTAFRDGIAPTPEMFLKAGIALKDKVCLCCCCCCCC